MLFDIYILIGLILVLQFNDLKKEHEKLLLFFRGTVLDDYQANLCFILAIIIAVCIWPLHILAKIILYFTGE